eukprot:403334341
MQAFQILSAVLSMVKTFFLSGFIYSLIMISIGFFIFACDKIYSTGMYQGIWCNVCMCLREGACRTCTSIFFKIILALFFLFSVTISVIQIGNIIEDPKWTSFPSKCTHENNDSQYCIRVDHVSAQNNGTIIQNYDREFVMHNGLTDLKTQIYSCLTKQYQLRITESNHMEIIGNQADPILGFAFDLAVKISKCKGITYSVSYQAESRLNIVYQKSVVEYMSQDFFKCLNSKIDAQYHDKTGTCSL